MLVGDEFGIAKVIVFVGTFKDGNDDRVEQCQSNEYNQERSHRKMRFESSE